MWGETIKPFYLTVVKDTEIEMAYFVQLGGKNWRFPNSLLNKRIAKFLYLFKFATLQFYYGFYLPYLVNSSASWQVRLRIKNFELLLKAAKRLQRK